MREIEQQLKSLKQEISTAQQEKATLEGRRAEKMRAISDFDCKNLKEARQEIKKLGKEKRKAEGEIEKGFGELKEQYEW